MSEFSEMRRDPNPAPPFVEVFAATMLLDLGPKTLIMSVEFFCHLF